MTNAKEIGAIPPADLAKYVLVCEVTETIDGEEKTNYMNLFAKTAEEAFLKVMTAQKIIDRPNTTIKVVGTYVRTKLTVTDNVQ